VDPAAWLSLVQINLDVFSMDDLLVTSIVQTDRNQAISRKNLTSFSGGTPRNGFSNYPLSRIGPADTVPGRRFMLEPLSKVQDARRQQQCSAGKQ
jgi:hypothetical protein